MQTKKNMLNTAKAHIKHKQIEEALKSLNEIINLWPDYTDAHIFRIDLARSNLDASKQEEYIDNAFFTCSADVRLYHRRALHHFSASRFDCVLNDLGEALTINPSHTASLLLKARTLFQTGLLSDSLAVYKEINDRPLSYYIDKCSLLLLMNMNEEALLTVEEGLENFPENIPLITTKGTSLKNLKQHSIAIKYLESKIHDINNESIAICIALVKIFTGLGDFHEAAKALSPFIEKYPYDGRLIGAMHDLCCESGKEFYSPDLFIEYAKIKNFSKGSTIVAQNILRIFGRHEEADALMPYLQPADSLPPLPLTALLTSIKDQNKISMPLLTAAWSLLSSGNSSFDDWRRRANWGAVANKTVGEYFSKNGFTFTSSEDEEIVSFPLCEEIIQAANRGDRLILAGSHHGPVSAALAWLKRKNLKTTIIASTGTRVDDFFDQVFLTKNPENSIKHLYKKLEQGYILASSPDMTRAQGYKKYPFFNGDIKVSTLIPRLAFSASARTFWIQPVWNDRSIVINAEELPSSRDFEVESEFVDVWFAHYLKNLESHFRSASPSNFSFGKFWENWR
ncbi:hypothetical protein C4K68_28040 [Pokkaliibacter plantistimulans]|uniref:Tetratricopeptide repeat protein n=1 Tax=Proteobacteria bacterium 228 TaxID=2083153 RepID=A0A2S5KHA6_9PROT|nr:hypothetical protein [Pokkaliibacter plantistimulans]PPC73973.1 hypothetical protein C4K68_28040 [Pokkaliibacter plantistimulans]